MWPAVSKARLTGSRGASATVKSRLSAHDQRWMRCQRASTKWKSPDGSTAPPEMLWKPSANRWTGPSRMVDSTGSGDGLGPETSSHANSRARTPSFATSSNTVVSYATLLLLYEWTLRKRTFLESVTFTAHGKGSLELMTR